MARSAKSTVPTSTYVTLALGMLLALGGSAFDGLLRGLCQGAGIGLILVSVVVLSAHFHRSRKRPDDGGLWLPSRDEDQ